MSCVEIIYNGFEVLQICFSGKEKSRRKGQLPPGGWSDRARYIYPETAEAEKQRECIVSAEKFIGKYDLVCTERVGFEADSAVFKGEGNLLQTSAGTVESIELFRSAVQFQGELCGSSADEDRAIAFFQKNLHFFRGKFGFFDFCVGQMEQKDPL